MTTPQFTHDCECCVFLGRFFGYDVWFHEYADRDDRTVIARYGNEGPEYSSCPASAMPAWLDGREWGTPAGDMPMLDWLFREQKSNTNRAILCGWAVVGVRWKELHACKPEPAESH